MLIPLVFECSMQCETRVLSSSEVTSRLSSNYDGTLYLASVTNSAATMFLRMATSLKLISTFLSNVSTTEL